MPTSALIESPELHDADDLLAGLPPLLSVVPQAGPAVVVYMGFGAVLLLLLVPPITLVVTLMGVVLIGAAALVVLVGLAGAIIAAPFLLVRRLREHPLPHVSLPVPSFGKIKVRRA